MLFVIAIPPSPSAEADPDTITLERLEEWCTGCVGFNDKAELYAVAIGDVTGDGLPEIVAAGMDHASGAQLSVFRWQQEGPGVLTTLFQTTSWLGGLRVNGVAVGNFDGIVGPEIATATLVQYGPSDTQGELRIWRWNGASFDVVASATWYDGTKTTPRDLAATPPVGGQQDLIVASVYEGGQNVGWSEVSRWILNPPPVGLVRAHRTGFWSGLVFSVGVGDTDGDGTLNVVAAGRYPYTCSSPCTGELRLYQLDLLGFTLLDSRSRPGGVVTGYAFWGVEIADVDGEARNEIVAAGGKDLIDGPLTLGEVTTWVHNKNPDFLVLEATSEDIPGRSYLNVAAGQLDRDSDWESVSVGISGNSGFRSAFSIWQHPIDAIVLDYHHDWMRTAYIWTVAIGDVDTDGDMEFVTGGTDSRGSSGSGSPAQLAIWNWNTAPRPDQWPMFHRTSLHDGSTPSVGPEAVTMPLWSKTQQGMNPGYYYHTFDSPVVLDDGVFTRVPCTTTSDGDSCIYAYDLAGDSLWGPVRHWLDSAYPMSSLAAGDGKIFYTGSREVFPNVWDGFLGALDLRTGARTWQITIPGEAPTLTVTVVGGHLWFATQTISTGVNHVYAYDTAGNRILVFHLPPYGSEPDELEKVLGSVTVWRDRAFIRATTRMFVIPTVDPNGDGVIEDSEILWYFHMGTPTGGFGNERTTPVIAFPANLNFPIVLVGGHDSYEYWEKPGARVYAIRADAMPVDKVVDRTDPEFVWTSDELGDGTILSTPAVSPFRAFVGGGGLGPSLFALDLESGMIEWQVDFQGYVDGSSAALASNGVLYFGAPARTGETGSSLYLHAIDAGDGHSLWRFEILTSLGARGIAPAIAANRVFVGNGVNYYDTDPSPFVFCFA